MPRVHPTQQQLKSILVGAVIDPNKKDDYIAQQIVEQGTPEYFETRAVEYMGEARRLRERMRTSKGKELTTLQELYTVSMTKALTIIAISVGKVIGPPEPKPKSAEQVQ